MAERDSILKIRTVLESHVGYKVKLMAKKGRKRTLIRHGVIESTYPCIFTVKLDKDGKTRDIGDRRVTFSYTDLLTKTVELVVYSQSEAALQDSNDDSTLLNNN